MGVMNCSRKDCNEIMCQTYIPSVGYICGDCKFEFENNLNEVCMTEIEFIEELKTFIEKPKDCFDNRGITSYEFFNKYTK